MTERSAARERAQQMPVKSAVVEMLIGRVKRARRSNMSDGIIRAGLIAEGWAAGAVIEAMEAQDG